MVKKKLTVGAARRQRARRCLPYVPEDIRGMLRNPDVVAPWRGRTWVTFEGNGKDDAKFKCEVCGHASSVEVVQFTETP